MDERLEMISESYDMDIVDRHMIYTDSARMVDVYILKSDGSVMMSSSDPDVEAVVVFSKVGARAEV